MNIEFDTIINVLTLLLGGGGGAFFTWRYLRQQETHAKVNPIRNISVS